MSKFTLKFLALGMLGSVLLHAQDAPTNLALLPAQPPASTNAVAAPTEPSPPSLGTAAKQFHDGDQDGALGTLNTVIQADPKNLNAYILRGAIYAQKQSWDLAEKDYQSALALDTTNDGVRFDLADLKFRQKKFDDARQAFVPLQNNRDEDVADLIKYKIFLCDLFLGHEDVAADELKAFDKAGAKASYYFGNAAWDLVHKQPEEARGWFKSAATIFPERKHLLYTSILKDMGYLPLPPQA